MADEKDKNIENKVAQNEPPVSKKDAFRKRIADKFPEEDLSDENAYYGKMSGLMDNYDKSENERKRISDAFSKNPANASLFQSVMNGRDLLSTYVTRYGVDGLISRLQDPEVVAKLQKEQDDYLKKVEESGKTKKNFDKNINKSLETIEGLVKDGTYTDEQVNGAISNIEEIVNDYFMGIIKPEILVDVMHAKSYSDDIANAANQAAVKAKNDKIDRAKLAKPEVPTLNGKSESVMQKSSEFKLPKNRNIWAGAKRNNL